MNRIVLIGVGLFIAAGLIVGSGAWWRTTPQPILSSTARTFSFNIGPQPLARALAAHSAVSGMQVLYTQDEPLRTQTSGVSGQMTADAALARLLVGSDLTYRHLSDNVVTLERRGHSSVGMQAIEHRPKKSDAATQQ